MTTSNAEPTTGRAVSAWLREAQRNFPLLQLVLTGGAFLVGVLTLPGFGSVNSITVILVLAALTGIAAVGQTIVVLVGGFDLSIPGFIVFGAVVVSSTVDLPQLGPLGVVLVLGVVPFALGGLVGWLCHRFAISPIVMTLAMNSVTLGVASLITAGQATGSAPDWLRALSAPIAKTFGIPLPPVVFIWLMISIAVTVFLALTGAGRRLYATGANRRAADNSLIGTRWVWAGVYGFSAVMSVIAGAVLLGFSGGSDMTLGQPYLFLGLAAVVIGGTVAGGPGDYVKTIIGACLMTVVSVVFIGNGFTPADRQILLGAIILLAMVIYGRERSLRDRV